MVELFTPQHAFQLETAVFRRAHIARLIRARLTYTVPMRALLLRVGIDNGCGGTLGPIFDDGSFELSPFPRASRPGRSSLVPDNGQQRFRLVANGRANSINRARPIGESSVDHSMIFRKLSEATANMRISKNAMTATSSGRSARLPVIISPRTASTAYVSGLNAATSWRA